MQYLSNIGVLLISCLQKANPEKPVIHQYIFRLSSINGLSGIKNDGSLLKNKL